jgi:tetratricopeptide (TPR) repeat protein
MKFKFPFWATPIRGLQNTLIALVFLTGWAITQQSAKPQLPPAKVTDERIRFFQAQLARDPDYYLNYNRLASAYAQKARETGDISYYELAEKALTKSLQVESQHEEAAAAFAQLGAVEFAEHRFPEALVSSERALKLADDPAARALAGDAQLEMGNYPEAQAQFAKLATTDDSQPHFGSDYLSATRRASLAWIRGDVSQAISLMHQATALAEKAHLPAENVAWTHFMLGEQMFQSGNIAGAEAEIKASLVAYPSYHRALAAMGQVRAAQLRFDDAADYYNKAISVIPLPTYASALGDIYYRIGKQAEADKQYALVEYIAQIGALSKQVYNRELALFYADHDRQLPQALALARKELELRHDVYTWDALAWVLLKNDQAREARDAMQKALTTGTQDSLLYFHAAAIERKLGSEQQSAQYAQRALAINAEFHVRYADQARQWLAAPAKVAGKQDVPVSR